MNYDKMFSLADKAGDSAWKPAPLISDAELMREIEGSAQAAPMVEMAQPQPTPTPIPEQQHPGVNGTWNAPVSNGINIGELISPEFATEIMDNLVSAGGAAGMAIAGIKTTKAAFAATEREKKLLEPAVGACIKLANMRFSSPYEALFAAVVAVYAPKAILIYINHSNAPKTERKAASAPPPRRGSKSGKRNSGRTMIDGHTGRPDCQCEKCTQERENTPQV